VNKLDLEGKVAVVTGGVRGIGLATAQRLIASGTTVITWDISRSSSIGCFTAAHYEVDVVDEEAVAQAMQSVVTDKGGIDILVNCAGVGGPHVAVSDCSLASWKRTLDVNLTGTFVCCRAAVPYMKTRPAGRIVNIASAAGKDGNPFSAPYACSKAGVIALTKSLAKELAATPIRVNCVTPGAVDTELFQTLTIDRRDAALAKIPMGRVAQPFEVAAMVAWLCSEDCSFSTGAAFDCSGGRATY
jgi:NAD(P)-dependent dehydrogenase (short-subunit alcohol dehydrogenase family)